MGGLSFSSVPRPGAPASRRRRPSRPLWRRPRADPLPSQGQALVPSHHVNLIDLDFPLQRHGRGLDHQTVAQLIRHGLRIGPAELQLPGDLPVGEVQAHEVKAQYPHAQRLVMAGQHRAGEVVEAPSTRLAAVALPAGLRLVTAVADHCRACTEGALDTLGPAMLAHQGEALGVVNQGRKIDQVGSSHQGAASSRGWVRASYTNS